MPSHLAVVYPCLSRHLRLPQGMKHLLYLQQKLGLFTTQDRGLFSRRCLPSWVDHSSLESSVEPWAVPELPSSLSVPSSPAGPHCFVIHKHSWRPWTCGRHSLTIHATHQDKKNTLIYMQTSSLMNQWNRCFIVADVGPPGNISIHLFL